MTEMHREGAATEPAGEAEGRNDEGQNRPVTAFDRLVLEKGHRPMIVSLISQHFRDKKSAASGMEQFDIVKGKGSTTPTLARTFTFILNYRLTATTGKGLILLLHGAPGVGKTSTAGLYYPCVAPNGDIALTAAFQICRGSGRNVQEAAIPDHLR